MLCSIRNGIVPVDRTVLLANVFKISKLFCDIVYIYAFVCFIAVICT